MNYIKGSLLCLTTVLIFKSNAKFRSSNTSHKHAEKLYIPLISIPLWKKKDFAENLTVKYVKTFYFLTKK